MLLTLFIIIAAYYIGKGVGREELKEEIRKIQKRY